MESSIIPRGHNTKQKQKNCVIHRTTFQKKKLNKLKLKFSNFSFVFKNNPANILKNHQNNSQIHITKKF